MTNFVYVILQCKSNHEFLHLTNESSDPTHSEPLKPNHFRLVTPPVNLSPWLFQPRHVKNSTSWKQAQAHNQQILKHLREYLPTLIQWQKWTKPAENLRKKISLASTKSQVLKPFAPGTGIQYMSRIRRIKVQKNCGKWTKTAVKLSLVKEHEAAETCSNIKTDYAQLSDYNNYFCRPKLPAKQPAFFALQMGPAMVSLLWSTCQTNYPELRLANNPTKFK